MNTHIKAFLWNAGGMALVGVASYVLNLGDIRLVEPIKLINIAVMVLAGLIVNRVTKSMNQ